MISLCKLLKAFLAPAPISLQKISSFQPSLPGYEINIEVADLPGSQRCDHLFFITQHIWLNRVLGIQQLLRHSWCYWRSQWPVVFYFWLSWRHDLEMWCLREGENKGNDWPEGRGHRNYSWSSWIGSCDGSWWTDVLCCHHCSTALEWKD
jgi:hypothetical protein